MGILLSKLVQTLFGNQEARVLILGLDNAGKTTILYKLYAPQEIRRTTPTIGFNVEYVHMNNIKFAVWDLGGQTKIRPFWRCYYGNTHAIIYVVDSADKERMGLARKELMAMLEEEDLKDSKLLIFANKQDQKEALPVSEVAKQLSLTSLKNRDWHIEKAAAIKNIGLREGLEWLSNALKKK